MVSNYDRIYGEITKVAERIEVESGVPSDDLISLAMRIVNAEDQNRIKARGINKEITNMIIQTTRNQPQQSYKV